MPGQDSSAYTVSWIILFGNPLQKFHACLETPFSTAAVLSKPKSRCMVSHCSDMQDLSRHTILRHLQDTEVPLYPRHYSYSSNYYTGLIIPMLYQYRRYQCHIYPSLSRCAIPRRLQDAALPLHLAITP
jgi:hypothetical protein